MSDNPLQFALHVLARSWLDWLPLGLLLFGFAKARRDGWRVAFVVMAGLWAFGLFYGPLTMGQDVNAPMFMAGLGAVVGVSLGFAMRRAPRAGQTPSV
jgi:hypothetical protein